MPMIQTLKDLIKLGLYDQIIDGKPGVLIGTTYNPNATEGLLIACQYDVTAT